MAKFFGSVAAGLGFYHIDIPDQVTKPSATKNVGVVYIESGEISKDELYKGLATIYRTNWPWQIRVLDAWKYLVKFPPHIDVEEVARCPCFGLPKEGVSVNVTVWEGDLEFSAELVEAW